MSVLIYAVGCDVCVSVFLRCVCLLADDMCAEPNARFVRVIATLLPSPVIITLNPAQLCRPVWASPQAVFMYEARLILLWGEFPLNRFPEIWPFLLPNPSTLSNCGFGSCLSEGPHFEAGVECPRSSCHPLSHCSVLQSIKALDKSQKCTIPKAPPLSEMKSPLSNPVLAIIKEIPHSRLQRQGQLLAYLHAFYGSTST